MLDAFPDHLIDTNILLRIARRDDPDHAAVDAALARLALSGATLLRSAQNGHGGKVPPEGLALLSVWRHGSEPFALYYTQQNIAEFWNVATRPAERNGFGLTAADVDREVKAIEKGMALLPDSAASYREWRQLVVAHSVLGVKVHDARLAAVMKVHGVTHLLTLNIDDFRRYPHVTAVHPRSLAYAG
jgi:predicted nucleic acid-binding protein